MGWARELLPGVSTIVSERYRQLHTSNPHADRLRRDGCHLGQTLLRIVRCGLSLDLRGAVAVLSLRGKEVVKYEVVGGGEGRSVGDTSRRVCHKASRLVFGLLLLEAESIRIGPKHGFAASVLCSLARLALFRHFSQLSCIPEACRYMYGMPGQQARSGDAGLERALVG